MPGEFGLVCGGSSFSSRRPSVLSGRKDARPAIVNGAAGAVAVRDGKPASVVGFTVRGGKIVEMDVLADPERLRQLDLAFLDD